jgi:hypothetical protein
MVPSAPRDIAPKPGIKTAKRSETNSPGLQAWEPTPAEMRPESIPNPLRGCNSDRAFRKDCLVRASEGRGLFPKKTFVESDSMAFQKLTQLFLIRKFAVMLGLIGNVGGNSLYVRLAH